MSNITLEDKAEGGLAIEAVEGEEVNELFKGFVAKLCLVGRFITEGAVDFLAMHKLWQPYGGPEKVSIYEK